MTQPPPPPPPPSRPEEARASFSQSGQLDTRDSSTYPADLGNRIAVTHAQLGDLYLAVNQAAEAAKHYEAAVHVRPRFMDIRAKFAESLIGEGRVGGHSRVTARVRGRSAPARGGASTRRGPRGCGSRMEAVRDRRSSGYASPRVPRIGRRYVSARASRRRPGRFGRRWGRKHRVAARSLLLLRALASEPIAMTFRCFTPAVVNPVR